MSTEDSAEFETDWTAPDGSEWQVGFTLKRIGGRFECVGLEVWQHPFRQHADVPLRAKTLRALPFASCLAHARSDSAARVTRIMERSERFLGTRVRAPELDGALAAVDEARGTKSGRRVKYDRAYLERVAAVYSAACREGISPTRDTADVLGIPYNTARKLVWKARNDLHLLPKGPNGVACGSEEVE